MALLIGALIGSILGLTGAGGSVFAVPLLIMLLDLPVTDAVGVALGAVAASAIYGSLRNGRSGSVLWHQAILLGAAGAVVSPLGRYLGAQLPEYWLLAGFCLLALAIATRMLSQSWSRPEATRIVRSSDLQESKQGPALCRLSATGHFQWGFRCVGGLLLSGAVVGLLTGLFGVGGGFLIVPWLMYLNQVSIQQAIATSLLIIAAVSASGFASYWNSSSDIDFALLATIASGGVLGMVLGQFLGRRLAGPRLQQVFAVSLATIALVTLVTQA